MSHQITSTSGFARNYATLHGAKTALGKFHAQSKRNKIPSNYYKEEGILEFYEIHLEEGYQHVYDTLKIKEGENE